MTVYTQANDPHFQGGEATPNRTSAAVVTSDTVDFALYPKNVTVTTAGNVNVLPLKATDGQFVQIVALLAGFTLPFRVRRINATGTSATLTALTD